MQAALVVPAAVPLTLGSPHGSGSAMPSSGHTYPASHAVHVPTADGSAYRPAAHEDKIPSVMQGTARERGVPSAHVHLPPSAQAVPPPRSSTHFRTRHGRGTVHSQLAGTVPQQPRRYRRQQSRSPARCWSQCSGRRHTSTVLWAHATGSSDIMPCVRRWQVVGQGGTGLPAVPAGQYRDGSVQGYASIAGVPSGHA